VLLSGGCSFASPSTSGGHPAVLFDEHVGPASQYLLEPVGNMVVISVQRRDGPRRIAYLGSNGHRCLLVGAATCGLHSEGGCRPS